MSKTVVPQVLNPREGRILDLDHLVMTNIAMENDNSLIGKLTISMAIFHSYVTNYQRVDHLSFIFRMLFPPLAGVGRRFLGGGSVGSRLGDSVQ